MEMHKYFHHTYMRKSLVIYDFAPDPSEFPNIWGKFYFLFYLCIHITLIFDIHETCNVLHYNHCLDYEQIIHHALCIVIEFTWRTVENDCIVTVSLFKRNTTVCSEPGAWWPPAAWSAAWSADCWHCPAGTALLPRPPARPLHPPPLMRLLSHVQTGDPLSPTSILFMYIVKNTTAWRLH